MSAPTMVPYGERMVPLDGGVEIAGDSTCSYCKRYLPIDLLDGDHYRGFAGTDGDLYCDERCEILSRVDLRWLLRGIIAGNVPTPDQAVKVLSRFGDAFEVVKDVTVGRL